MNPLRVWNTFWFAPISARPLGLFRIIFGILLLVNLGFLAFNLDYWYTDAGLLQGPEALAVAGPYRFSPLNWIQDPLSVRVFFALTTVITLLFTLGWHTRVMGILLYLSMLSIHHRNLLTTSGADALVMIMTFYVMFSPCGAAYSLDARRAERRRGTVAEALILPWVQRLIQLQICLIYFNTAVLKCNGASWLNGTALHYVLLNTEVGRPILAWLTEYPLVINVMTYGAVFIEFMLAFCLWFRPTRSWAIVAGISLHAAILLTVNIPIFGEVMVACYLLFLTPEELDAALRYVNPRTWFGRSRRKPRADVTVPGRVDAASPIAGPHRPQAVPEPVGPRAIPRA